MLPFIISWSMCVNKISECLIVMLTAETSQLKDSLQEDASIFIFTQFPCHHFHFLSFTQSFICSKL